MKLPIKNRLQLLGLRVLAWGVPIVVVLLILLVIGFLAYSVGDTVIYINEHGLKGLIITCIWEGNC